MPGGWSYRSESVSFFVSYEWVRVSDMDWMEWIDEWFTIDEWFAVDEWFAMT